MTGIVKDGAFARVLGDRLWEQRDTAGIVHGPRDEDHAVMEYRTDIRLAGDISMRIRPGAWDVTADMGGHERHFTHYDATMVIRVWRAIQCLRIAEALGDTQDPATTAATPQSLGEKVLRGMGVRPAIWGGRNMDRRLDELLAAIVARGAYENRKETQTSCTLFGEIGTKRATWTQVGNDVSFSIGSTFGMDGDRHHIVVKHTEWGNVQIEGPKTRKAMQIARSKAHAGALGAQTAVRTIAFPPTGNARIARIANLCRSAVELEPDLVDEDGSSIRPLVERHLPDLLRRHAETAAVADARDLAGLDEDLERGVEIVRRATENAVALLADRRRDGLLTQLRFLETRHPSAVPRGETSTP